MDFINKIDPCPETQIMKNKIIQNWPYYTNKPNPNYFPGPQPVSLELKTMNKLKDYPYKVSEKTDGVRHLMLITENGIYLINRSFDFFTVPFTVEKGLTALLDGELIEVDNGLDFSIHDCVYKNNINCGKLDLNTRLNYARQVAELITCPDTMNVAVKEFYNTNQLSIISGSKNKHATDGLIFTPTKLGISFGTQFTLFKWKPKHTFDFKVVYSGKRIFLYVTHDRLETKFLCINQGDYFNQFIKSYKLLVEDDIPNISIVECIYDVDTNRYKPILVRKDKLHPNTKFTISKTLLNVHENITFDDLIKFFKI